MSDITLGIIGGGQLGSMLSAAANKINIDTVIFIDCLLYTSDAADEG